MEMRSGKRRGGTHEAILIKRRSKDGFQAGNLGGDALMVKVGDSRTRGDFACWLAWRRAQL